MVRQFRKPLIVMTPEEPAAAQGRGLAARRSSPSGEFQTVIGEIERARRRRRSSASIALLGQGLLTTCSRRARERRRDDVAIVRVEQLYPFPHKALRRRAEAATRTRTEVVWCQDEPQNQGAWFYDPALPAREHARRPEAAATPAAPAVGVAGGGLLRTCTSEQQKALLDAALRQAQGQSRSLERSA
ncbi:MAG: hypothetical protein MZW92_34135 [Comamonadaceae bacterium]|nr:hypothetical protein [Comamonadaceae bacterium]